MSCYKLPHAKKVLNNGVDVTTKLIMMYRYTHGKYTVHLV